MLRKVLCLVLIFFFSFSILTFSQEKISLNFKDADIRVVLQTLAEKSGVNIVSTPQVEGLISVQLKDVDWQTALEVILKTYQYGYQWIGDDIILVSTLEDLTERRAREEEAEIKEPLDTKVFFVHFSKAADVQVPMQALLSERGRITVDVRTNALIITDTQSKLRDIGETIVKLDKETAQIYIEARFVEVNDTALKEIGFDWSTGSGNIPALEMDRKVVTVYYETLDEQNQTTKDTYEDVVYATPVPINTKGGKQIAGQIIPSEEKGLELLFQKLTGSEFEVAFRALENNEVGNVISNPKLLTLENIESKILVGTRMPIPIYSYSTESGQRIISGYAVEEVGIMFNVTPKVVREDTIQLKIRPEVSEITGYTGPDDERPIISTREVVTEISLKDGETIMIGGLVKDKVINGVDGVPILKDIPILGWLFRRETTNIEKIDLIIFITARIVPPSGMEE